MNLDRLRASDATVRRLALSSVVVNVLLVVTGGAVRLTGSGLGCPTWPKCTDSSYHNTPAYGFHGYIEFGNRLLTFVVAVVVTLTFLAAVFAVRRRRSVVWLSFVNGLTIPAQAVIGGLTVLTKLNPYVVAAHFLFTVLIIAASYALWKRTREGDEPARSVVRPPLRPLTAGLAGLTVVVLTIGTVVTGSGPHAGDQHAKRTGLDPGMIAQLHADAVMLLIGASVAAWFAFRATDAPHPVRRAALVLVGLELGQGAIGFVQYFTHLPVLLVGLHMAGSAAVWLAALALLFATRTRGPVPAGRASSAVLPE
ncbi:COX15/CtaA family protein [Actinocatenispora rupis]|uniref:COX15/CtaA family protein n=1 Tax=Actinocatenispora rupis TaxID=519421 RepID=UPI0019440737|nr:COX15/CtaA family protein [Actinocatenispora rupis]